MKCKWCGETCDEPNEMFCCNFCAQQMESEARTYWVSKHLEQIKTEEKK